MHMICLNSVSHQDIRYIFIILYQIRIDGPYGAPASNIFRASHAVLVSTGIGVTPFSSILQSIMFRYRQSKSKCPKCQHTWTCNMKKMEHLNKVNTTFQKLHYAYNIISELLVYFYQRWISSGLTETKSPSNGSYICSMSQNQSRRKKVVKWNDFLIYIYT